MTPTITDPIIVRKAKKKMAMKTGRIVVAMVKSLAA